MRLLIAGCGYLGCEIARQSMRAGWDVLGVARSEGSANALRAQGIAAAVADISSTADCAGLPSADLLVHCASSQRGGEAEYRTVYLEGCRTLLGSHPEAKFLFVGSSSVYAQTDGEWVDESSPAIPPRPTGKVLLEAEQVVLERGGVVARLAGIYGPDRSVLLRNFLSGSAVIEVRENCPDGRWLNQIHRDDAAAAIRQLLDGDAADAAGKVWNVCDSTPLNQRQIYAGMAAKFGRPMPPEVPPDFGRKRGWTNKRLSNGGLRMLGWKPKYASYLDALEGDERITASVLAQLA